ncbi:hypothetical protein VIGAN_02247000 [Vigna angularis var. angularis]|uniref:Uncharacterized protein n=1 Tax=Vigna angularis var. angularis TaxID=157739 RepID=A0A0S3RG86_PHAAN|nr:hypothetical protein VIGAN_02247000 [Vigna angularis var. angularis]
MLRVHHQIRVYHQICEEGFLCDLGISLFGGSTEAGFEEDKDTRGFTVFTHGSREIGVLWVFSFLFWVLLFFAGVRQLMKEEKTN